MKGTGRGRNPCWHPTPPLGPVPVRGDPGGSRGGMSRPCLPERPGGGGGRGRPAQLRPSRASPSRPLKSGGTRLPRGYRGAIAGLSLCRGARAMRCALLTLLVAVAAVGAAPGPSCPVTAPGESDTKTRLGPAPRRTKRFASVPRFVELLVVADEAMARFHGAGLRPYLLTVLAAAARSFRHGSLGNAVELRVTRLLVLGPGTPGPPPTSNAAEMLRNFCQWQQGLNVPDEDSPLHFDTALLFTRQDLCGAATCATLGMADVGTVCDPARSCAVVEDDGLQSAFTVAHELGHVFNMLHDTAQPCRELNGGTAAARRVMAPVLSSLEPGEMWSPCSARFITDFLDNGHGHCLLDQPPEWLPLPSALPGSVYPLLRQCQLAFGPESRHCGDQQPPCARLWCTGHTGGRSVCQTKHFPWADGTPCAPGSACMDGACVSITRMQELTTPVDGAWGPWGPWSGCSRSCGGGVRLSHRGCTEPEPRHGGRFCRGKRTRVQSCSVEECPGGSALAFREEQCAEYNRGPELVRGLPAPRDWVPRYSGVAERDRCKLICQSQTLGYYHVLQQRVADGTPCSPESTGVCVRGRCIPAGCDRIIGSKKKFDKCMNCGGDGSGCTKISGSFTKPRYGYNDVVTIPAGATHILVRQVSAPGAEDVFLALRRPDGESLLNGGYILVPSATDVALGKGITLRYSGATAATETLEGRGPLPQPVLLQALVVDERRAPRLKFSFFVPCRPSEAWEKQKAQILEILKSRRPHR
ncbi:A disintegrin and metalloproteinase with thrombospondin motifs 4 isoform X2 [Pezoporus occidentalis]|uniref:A disintegrin and metalloproteinase with thrombospondin motifs 4 isoform X2 n=1 Tax=Pezoporus occidentalis TaxID=407982 RepID=UPI002F910A69